MPVLAGINSIPASSRARRFNSPLTQALLTGRSIYLMIGLRWLLDLRKARALTSRAVYFCSNWRLHEIRFLNCTSNQIRRHSLYQSHVIVLDVLLPATVPSNSHTRPIRFNDRATVSLVFSPANAVASFQKSRLFAGHSNTIYSDRAHVSASDGEIVRFGR